jgi:hypothetical protein
MSNEADYIELGLACADICTALDRGMHGKKMDDLNQSVCEAIKQLTTWVRPVMRMLHGSPTTSFVVGLWQRSEGRSSSRVGEMQSLDCCTQSTPRK